MSINKVQIKLPDPYEIQNSIIMMINIRQFDDLTKYYKEMITEIYSKILEIINLTVFEHFGEVISFDSNKVFCLWEYSKYHRGKSLTLKNLDEMNLFEERNIYLKSDDINKSFISEESIKEEYVDYEVGKYRIENIHNFDQTDAKQNKLSNENSHRNISNLAIICAIKLLSRLNFNDYIKKKLKLIEKNNLGIEIIIHKGITHHLIINTDYKY